MTRAFLCPGQGSQAVGMGRSLGVFPAARSVFEEVDEALGEALSRLMFEGPEAELTLTANAQPALMAVSLAVLAVLRTEAGFDLGRDVSFVAGHSLGEYSALAAAGALSLGDAARLLRLRGRAMQDAVAVGEGAMAALVGAEPEMARTIAAKAVADGGLCQMANDNGGGQVVVSGTAEAVARAVDLAKTHGVKRAVMLSVSAPFHCDLMRPAAEAMAEALDQVEIREPAVPLVANVSARPVTAPDAIRRGLVEQVCGTVRWRESMAFLAGAGVTEALEAGAGKVLTGLMKRAAPAIACRAVGTAEDIAAYRVGVGTEP